MRGQFGDAYAASVAKDYVLADLGGRTVDQALAEGIEPKTIWRAVCEAFEIPKESRGRHSWPLVYVPVLLRCPGSAGRRPPALTAGLRRWPARPEVSSETVRVLTLI